ncbi:MAG: leucine-rich repeat domain-containing protein [Clostridium sp.]|nr:leucine-rich repeat domain-containing protein [Clostridium sp.]
MHNRKIIAKGLAIGITISSFSLNSMANAIDEYKMIKEERVDNSSKDNIFENIIKSLFIKKSEPREIIEVNKNIIRNSVLEITLSDGQFVEDLSGNPNGYETVKVTTTGDKKLVEADYNNLRLSGISKIDLSSAQANSISNNAFKGATHLVSFEFPQGITSIGNYAFDSCINLEGNLIIPNSVRSMGAYAFNGCSSLTGDLVIPNSVTSMSERVFQGCSGFNGELVISDSLTSIGMYTFSGCSKLTGDLVIPNSITSIGNSAFYGCSSFNGELVISDSLTTIGNSIFNGCSGFIGNLIIPDSVTSIGSEAFRNCRGFDGDLIIPNLVTSIGSSAFNGCSGLDGKLVLSNSLKSMGSTVFSGCNGFTGDLIIPNSVTTMGERAFQSCNGFSGKLLISNSLTSIGAYTFSGCSKLTGDLVIPDSVTSISNSAFSGCSGLNGKLVIPNSVKTLGTDVFKNCSNLTGNLIIPDSLTSIGSSVFNGCSKLTGDLIIPDSVTSIGNNAFQNCSGFNGDLIIPNSVTTIGSSAFTGCGKLVGDLIIPDSVTSIGLRAFQSCSGFDGELVLSNSLISIGDYAFAGCPNLSGDVYIPNTITTIGTSPFSNLNNISRFIVKVGEEDEASDYKQSIIEKLTVSKTKIEAPYDMDFSGTWIESSGIEVIYPTFKSIVDGLENEVVDENNEKIVLDIPMEFSEESTILIDGKESNFPKANSDGKYVFTDEGDYELVIKTKLGTIYNLEFGVRTKEMQEVQDLVTEIIDTTPTVETLDTIREKVNALPESFRKEALQRALNSMSVDLELERENVSANLDVYIKCENMLSLSLDTNSVTFDNYNGTEDVVKPSAINLTVNSSLSYKVNVYLESNIVNKDGSNAIDVSLFNIKASSDTDFKEFTGIKTAVVLLDDQVKGNDVVHSIDLKLKANLAHKSDIYKTTIKFEIVQK